MPARVFQDQPRAITEAGELLPGASLSISETGTTDALHAFADPNYLTPHPNPIKADGAGRFPSMWFNLDEVDYRARLLHPDTGAVVWDLDPLEPFPLTEDGEPLDNSGEPMPFARLTFWRSGTTALQAIYDDADLITELDNPLTADEFGVFPTIYLDDTLDYRVRLERGDGRLVYDVDPVQLMPGPQLIITAGEAEGAIGFDFNLVIGSLSGDINVQLPTAQVLELMRVLIFSGSNLQVRIRGATSTPPVDVFASLAFTDKDGVPRTLLSSSASSTTPATRTRQWSWTGLGAYFEDGERYALTFTP